MSAQTSYDLSLVKGYPGLIYAQAPSDIVSRAVETVAGIPFGVAVSRGTDKETQCVIGGTDFLGIAIRSLDKEGAANTGAIQWNETEAAGILRYGYIWVISTFTSAVGQGVIYNNTTGAIRSDGTGPAGAGETLLDGATFETSSSAASLSLIRIDSAKTTAGV